MLGNHAHFLIAKAFLFPPQSLLAFTISHLLCSLAYRPRFFNPTQFRPLIFLSHDYSQPLILTITPQHLRSVFLFQDLLLASNSIHLHLLSIVSMPSSIYLRSNYSRAIINVFLLSIKLVIFLNNPFLTRLLP